MKDPRGFLEDNYGKFSEAEQALIDLVVRLIERVDSLETQLQALAERLDQPDWRERR